MDQQLKLISKLNWSSEDVELNASLDTFSYLIYTRNLLI